MDKQSTTEYCRNKIIYIPTMTGKLKSNMSDMDYALYSPSSRCPIICKANKITIWDNHTFYLYKRYNKSDKHIKALNHYLWLIKFIKNNYQQGITLITPDVDWLCEEFRNIVEYEWSKHCSMYPQLYVPDTWCFNTNNLNIVGYALRSSSPLVYHPNWVHCLAHIRNDINTKLLTYDSSRILH